MLICLDKILEEIMKEARKYHIEITTSKRNKVHKFSSFAFEFLSQKLEELSKNEDAG